MARKYDRSAENMGNIVALEHVNTTIPDQQLATLFYVAGLGLTRDPYLMPSTNNMWINVGRSQFHMPTNKPQVLRGRTGLVMPDLDSLVKRLETVKDQLKGTKFSYSIPNGNDVVDVTSPWGNWLRCHMPDERFHPVELGMPYVQFDVPKGTAKGIARFYRKIFNALARVDEVEGAPAAHVQVGFRQELIFRETSKKIPKFDGHHIQIYIVDFAGPHKKLNQRGLVSQEDSQYQYRFIDIVDPDDGKKLFEIEHEVRSMTHPLYARPLINRNPNQNLQAFAPGHETRVWASATPYS